MGRDVVRDICRRDGRPFVAEVEAQPANQSAARRAA
jgi:hypothetical protein